MKQADTEMKGWLKMSGGGKNMMITGQSVWEGVGWLENSENGEETT